MKNSLLVSVVFLGAVEIVYAQGAIDYYPLHVGDYWVQHTDSVSGQYEPTTFRQDIEGTDLILGEEYYRRSNWLTVDDDSSESKWYTWVRGDTSGILLGAFGDTNIIDSAAIFDPPLLWLPNEIVNVGHTWDFNAPEMGGHFFFAIGSITDTVEVPAGIFYDCLRIYGLLVDTSGDSIQMNLFYYAQGIGEVSNYLYSLSWGYAILELTEYSIGTSIEKDRIMEIPANFHLQQNYPNPFNPMTSLEYQLPKAADVEIVIYNLLGQMVTTLVNATQPAGYHQVTWDASNVSSGIYFYRLIAGDFIQTRKMLLLK